MATGTVEALTAVEAPLAGVVINRVKDVAAYGYASGYGAGYRYAYQSPKRRGKRGGASPADGERDWSVKERVDPRVASTEWSEQPRVALPEAGSRRPAATAVQEADVAAPPNGRPNGHAVAERPPAPRRVAQESGRRRLWRRSGT